MLQGLLLPQGRQAWLRAGLARAFHSHGVPSGPRAGLAPPGRAAPVMTAGGGVGSPASSPSQQLLRAQGLLASQGLAGLSHSLSTAAPAAAAAAGVPYSELSVGKPGGGEGQQRRGLLC